MSPNPNHTSPMSQASSGSTASPDAVHVNASRRTFLKAGVLLTTGAGGGMLLGFSLPAAGGPPLRAGVTDELVNVASPPQGVFAPNAFIQIGTDGQVTLIMSKVEMGQGIYTAISMLIAEELEVPLSRVVLAHAPPDEKRYFDPLLGGQLTGGSTSIRYAWDPMRQAGATARTVLVNVAAARWQVDPSTCKAEDGTVVHAASGRRLGYGDLVADAARQPVPKDVKLKSPDQFRVIGKPTKRLDGVPKGNGTAVFGMDVRLPDMQYAIIVNCPVFGGKVASVDDSVAKKVPGVKQVVVLDDIVAVVGEHTWAAKRGASALKIRWNDGPNGKVSTRDLFDDMKRAAKKQGAVAKSVGDIRDGLDKAASRFDAAYEQPFLAHAPMEPVNCTLHVKADSCEVWTGTQVPTRAVDEVNRATGIPKDKIVLYNHLLGGGFGRRLEADMVYKAAAVARRVNGPVKVIWSREEDVQHDIYRPCYYDEVVVGLDSKGKPVAWHHKVIGSSIIARFAPPLFKDGVDIDAVEVLTDLPYAIGTQQIEYIRQEPRHIPTGWWRGVGPTRATFVVESLIDELAIRANADPVQYRQSLLGQTPRAKNVLDIAARMANWGTPLPKGSGRGVSVLHAFGSFMCMVAEVTVDKNNDVFVKRVACAVDAGMLVNPETVEAQMQGGIIFGITGALWGEITIADGRVQQTNFADYRVLRIHETPKIEVHLVKSAEAPGGIGEPGTSAIGAALANAVYAATGRRLRALPLVRQLKTPAGKTASKTV